jgi:hypothetical protein
MAEFNPINYVGFQNPQAAIQLQQQQALAKMLQERGNVPSENKLANPGGLMIPTSPWETAGKTASSLLGMYMQSDANDKLAESLKGNSGQDLMSVATNQALSDSSTNTQGDSAMGPATKDAVAGKYQQDLASMLAQGGNGGQMSSADLARYNMADQAASGLGAKMYEQAQKKQNAFDEAQAKATFDTQTDASGVVRPKMSYLPPATGNSQQQLAAALMPASLQSSPAMAPMMPPVPITQSELPPIAQPNVMPSPSMPDPNIQVSQPLNNQDAATIGGLYDGQPAALTDKAPASSDVPMAKDGKPFISGVTSDSKEVGAGPKYNTDNTKYGVETSGAMRDADIKAYDNMGAQATNANQMQGRLGYMEDALKSGNAGGLISQYPELANKLVAAGVITDKGEIKNVAAFQTYESAQVQEVMGQIKSAGAGSAQNRILAQEFNALSEKMGNPSQRPEAIHEIMAMTQGFADWNKDMAEGYHTHGGLDNRLANKSTLRPTDYQIGFAKDHPVYDYIKMARKDIGPFKGMAGNNGENRISIIDPNGNAGTIDKEHLQGLLSAGGKLAQ